jgi:sec-independent protein translocase protein TatC
MTASSRPEEVSDEGRMTIWQHLAELRSRLIKCFIAIGVGMVVGWIIYPWVLDFLREPWCGLVDDVNSECRFLVTDPLETFAVRIKISAYVGIALAMPVILWQVWRFVTPGLYPHEKRYALPFVLSSLVLFVFGALLAYITLNPALSFLIGLGGDDIEAQYTITKYTTLVVYMMLAFGVAFEFPVLLVALQMIGILSPRQLLGWWRAAIVIIAVVAAVITPSQDPISMIALVAPMCILYFGSIGIGAAFTWRKRKRDERAGAAAES